MNIAHTRQILTNMLRDYRLSNDISDPPFNEQLNSNELNPPCDFKSSYV